MQNKIIKSVCLSVFLVLQSCASSSYLLDSTNIYVSPIHNSERKELEESIRALRYASSPSEQLGKIYMFQIKLDKCLKSQNNLRGCQFLPFDENGELLSSDNYKDMQVKYVIAADFDNKPPLFRPFLIKVLSAKSWRTLVRPY